MDTKISDEKYFARSGSLGIEIMRTDETFVYDADGKKYIDLFMGWSVGNIGWGNTEVKDALRNFTGPDYVYPGFLYKPWAELAQLLAEIAPGELIKSYRTTGGSESVDTALQIAMSYTGRKKFLSLEGSYHGNTISTLSIGGSANEKSSGKLLPYCYKIQTPLDKKALTKLEARLKSKEIAAFIMEPIVCSLGVYIPDKTFMNEVHGLCKKYETLFVIDEVATGFGRTGKLFASEHFELEPDIMCLAKGMSGGYAGIGVTLTTETIYEKVKGEVDIYSTYGWHPLSVEAALTNIRYLVKHRDQLFANAEEISELFRHRLEKMKFKKDAEIRIKGLAIAVDLKSDKKAHKLQEKCKEEGLLILAQDTSIIMFPALTIKPGTVNDAMDILEKCM